MKHKPFFMLLLALLVFPRYSQAIPIVKYESPNKDVSVKLILYLQPQYQFVHIGKQGNVSSFQIRRGRVGAEGYAFTQDLTYKVLFQMVGGYTTIATPGAAFSTPRLEDGYVDYATQVGIEPRVGQFKVYYDREELTPDTAIQFVDHSLVNEVFSFHRDLGVAIHGRPFGKAFEYAVYAMNNAQSLNQVNRSNFMILGSRLVFNVLGDPGYTMSDYENADGPELSFALASAVNKVGPPALASQLVSTTTVDALFKHRGFSFTGEGHYYWNKATKAKVYGVMAQTGYFVVPKKFEIAGRFSGVIVKGGATDGYEMGGCLNYYFFGHNLKVQLDYNYLMNGALTKGSSAVPGVNGPVNIVKAPGLPGFNSGQNDHRVRLQFQFLI